MENLQQKAKQTRNKLNFLRHKRYFNKFPFQHYFPNSNLCHGTGFNIHSSWQKAKKEAFLGKFLELLETRLLLL